MDKLNTKYLMNRFDLKPNKALGQNFIDDRGALESIVDGADIDGKCVLEIGAGLGTMTRMLSKRARHVVSVEIDRGLEQVLSFALEGCDNVTMLFSDFLKCDLSLIHEMLKGETIDVVANLPYYVTTPICMRLLKSGLPIESMTLMLQSEAAARFFAQPSCRTYGPLAVISQYQYTASRLIDLPPESYYPMPEVESTVVKLTRIHGREGFDKLCRLCALVFANRRKTIQNNLISGGIPREKALAACAQCGVPPSARAEAIAVDSLAALATALFD